MFFGMNDIAGRGRCWNGVQMIRERSSRMA